MILAARSRYFNSRFSSGMRESQSESLCILDLPTVTSVGTFQPPESAIKQFLSFLYTDNVTASVSNAVFLLPMSDFYGLGNDKLKQICIKSIEFDLNEISVTVALQAAESIQCTQLKKLFLQEIVNKYFVTVSDSKFMKPLSKNLLIEIIAEMGWHIRSQSKSMQ